ncbi:hypothetical protein DFJ74DRAFT_703371 [Hyaloraphidium curvatum]|nr:hypothetical protein DFJ74DRAFT_703371 [Hyaloraphidium curvatum]
MGGAQTLNRGRFLALAATAVCTAALFFPLRAARDPPPARTAVPRASLPPRPSSLGETGGPSPGPSAAPTEPPRTRKLYGFYNIFADRTRAPYAEIIADQLAVLNASGTWSMLERVFYNTFGPDGAEIVLPGAPKARRMKHLPAGDELETLGDLWDFCRADPEAAVLYWHNKGSANPSPINGRFRKALDCAVLTPRCATLMEEYDVCSLRFSAVPYPHFTGNFFWARCDHVARLVDPRMMRDPARLAAYGAAAREHGVDKCLESYVGLGRYWAEAWVSSLPDFRPADCLDARTGPDYIFAGVYENSMAWANLGRACPSIAPGWTADPRDPERRWGTRCGNASMLAQAPAYGGYGARRPHPFGKCDGLAWINARSVLLYGREAALAIRFRRLYGEAWPPKPGPGVGSSMGMKEG